MLFDAKTIGIVIIIKKIYIYILFHLTFISLKIVYYKLKIITLNTGILFLVIFEINEYHR